MNLRDLTPNRVHVRYDRSLWPGTWWWTCTHCYPAAPDRPLRAHVNYTHLSRAFDEARAHALIHPSQVRNNTGRPELVLSANQWDRIVEHRDGGDHGQDR